MTFDEFSPPGYLTRQGACVSITEREGVSSLFVQHRGHVVTLILHETKWGSLARGLERVAMKDKPGRVVIEGNRPERSITIARGTRGFTFRVHAQFSSIDIRLTANEIGDLQAAALARSASSSNQPERVTP